MDEPTSDSDIIIVDGPDNTCFGCSPFNDHGLKLVWRRTADGVEAHYTAAERWNGAPGVVHGGVQAALLDETIGIAINRQTAESTGNEIYVVTASFELEYRRPVPTGAAIVLRARQLRIEGRSHFGEGEIADGEGNILTRARARWVRVDPPDDLAARRGG